jgi:hypothetical protein
LAFFEQAVLTPDALQGTMAEGKIELADETASPEGEQLPAQSENLLFDVEGSFAGLAMRSAGKLDEAAQSLPLIAAQPLAYGRNGGLEKTSGGLDAPLPGRLHQTQAMIVGVTHFTNQDEVRGRHAGCIVGRDRVGQRVVEKTAAPSRLGKRFAFSTFPPPRRRLRLFSSVP